MSVHAFPQPSLMAPTVELRARVEALQQLSLQLVAEADLTAALTELTALESQVASLRLDLLGEVERRRIADREAATGTDAWAAALTGEGAEKVRGGLRLARLLRQKYHHTREAFASGGLRLAQVRVILDAAEQAPSEATEAQLAAAEDWLVGRATGAISRTGRPLSPRRLRQVARRMFDVVDRDLANKHEAKLLGRESEDAEHDTFLQLYDNGNGTWSGRFTVPDLHGRLLNQALDRLAAPRRSGRPGAPDPTALSGPGWGRNSSERSGLAFLELLEHLPTRGHAANGVTLLVKISLDALRGALRDALGESLAAGLDTGVRITAAEARRLACNASIIPAVLGGNSVPLDLGRTRRLHSRSQRHALALAHDSCAIGGCERPFAWCEIHHPAPWSQGGPTDLANAAPLCGYHHRRAHDERYDLRRHSSGEWRFHRRR